MRVRLVIKLPRATERERIDALRWILPQLVDLRRRAPERFELTIAVEDEPNGESVEV